MTIRQRGLLALASLALATAGGARAMVYTLSLSGDPTMGSYSTFTQSGRTYHDFYLDLGLGGAAPFTLMQGDEVQTTITLTSALSVPAVNDYQFVGVNLTDGVVAPVGASTTGTFTFTGLSGSITNPANTGCGNCASNVLQEGMGASTFAFTGLYSDGTLTTLAAPYAVNDVSLSYQVDTLAVPEPASWALMLIGLGGLGVLARGERRRAVTP